MNGFVLSVHRWFNIFEIIRNGCSNLFIFTERSEGQSKLKLHVCCCSCWLRYRDIIILWIFWQNKDMFMQFAWWSFLIAVDLSSVNVAIDLFVLMSLDGVFITYFLVNACNFLRIIHELLVYVCLFVCYIFIIKPRLFECTENMNAFWVGLRMS